MTELQMNTVKTQEDTLAKGVYTNNDDNSKPVNECAQKTEQLIHLIYPEIFSEGSAKLEMNADSENAYIFNQIREILDSNAFTDGESYHEKLKKYSDFGMIPELQKEYEYIYGSLRTILNIEDPQVLIDLFTNENGKTR